MDRRETEEVIVNVAQAWVGAEILAVLLIAALPVIGWALLLGLAGAVEAPGVAALVVVGLVVWGWIAGMRKKARWARERAAEEARLAKFKEPHGGKDRYFVREGYTIKLMYFDPGRPGARQGARYYWAHTYDLPYAMRGSEHSLVRSSEADMWCDPKRLERWQAVFEEWIENDIKPSQQTWWMFPDEAAQYAEREAQYQQRLKLAVCPENSLTHAHGAH
jgi:hypothetical protein